MTMQEGLGANTHKTHSLFGNIFSDQRSSFDEDNFQLVVTDGIHFNRLTRFLLASSDALEKIQSICLQCNNPRYATEDSTLTKSTSSPFLCYVSSDFNEKSSHATAVEEASCTYLYREHYVNNQKPSDIDVILKNSRRVLFDKEQKLSPLASTSREIMNSSGEISGDRYAAIVEVGVSFFLQF